jgi:hypothetical protein
VPRTSLSPAFVIALVGMPLVVSGCFGLNRIHIFTVSIVNDTSGAVVVRDCAHFCSSSLISFDLAPGASADVHRTTDEHKYFSVTTAAGRHVGCLDLFFERAEPGANVEVSGARSCPAGSGPPWKTVGLLLLVLGVLLAIGLYLVRPAKGRRAS